MNFLERHSLELQFWGYEVGNIVAAIAGAGGVSVLLASLKSAFNDGSFWAALQRLAIDFPEAAATIGVVALVVFAFPVSSLATRVGGPRCADLVHAAAVPVALGLLVYAVVATASPFTVAACAFVTGSCLLRGAAAYPLLLKLGGLSLALGGLALSAAGLTLPMDSAAEQGLAITTFFAGAYVMGAGLLTYRGGVFVISGMGMIKEPNSPIASLLHPTSSPLARFFSARCDFWIDRICTGMVLPAIFWASKETKTKRPFYLSMLARLPWRGIAIAFALASGTEIGLAFALANLLWALGDIAIGALDAPKRRPASIPGVIVR